MRIESALLTTTDLALAGRLRAEEKRWCEQGKKTIDRLTRESSLPGPMGGESCPAPSESLSAQTMK